MADRALVACGEFTGKRVRVVSLDPPYKTMFEAHPNEIPYWPPGGSWIVERLQFVGGQYLVEELHFGGRIDISLEETTIYDLDTWKPVWSGKSGQLRTTISSDGRNIAYIRRPNTLTISSLTKPRGG